MSVRSVGLLAVLFALGSVLLLAGTADAAKPVQVTEDWAARYHQKSPESNFLHGLAVGSGNVYVTGGSGETSWDFATVTYDARKGKELWGARYDGPGAGDDTARAVAADDAGNAYVTGYSYGIGTSADFATIKYDAFGRELWVRRYDGSAHGFDQPNAIEIDDAGNVYVTGSVSAASGSEATTIKYDASGNVLWVARFEQAGAGALAVDEAGHVYVTGSTAYTGPGSSGGAYLTIEYDSTGNQLWAATYDGPTDDPRESALDLGIDSAGNVYVTGESWGGANPGTFVDVATVKYNGSGNEVWVRRFDAQGANDEPAAIAVSDEGDVHVATNAHWKEESFYDEVTTLKYDASGSLEWLARYPGSGVSDVVLDAAGNVYVNGSAAGAGGGDLATVKYDPEGNQVWEAVHAGPLAGATEQSRALAVDGAGNVYAASESPGGDTSWDYLTVKYMQEDVRAN